MMTPSSSADGGDSNSSVDGTPAETAAAAASSSSSSPSPPVFDSTSPEDAAQVLHVSFATDPAAPLGVQLINCCAPPDRETESMFRPGFAVVGRLLDGDTVARRAGVAVGDVIVAVNGAGFRRFAPDLARYETIGGGGGATEEEEEEAVVTLDNAVAAAADGQDAYHNLLAKLKAVKAANGDPPLVLTLERHGWDSPANAWGRFLKAREGAVPAAMQMHQQHRAWRAAEFPVPLQSAGLQQILRCKAVSEIDLVDPARPPTVYVEYAKLLELQAAGTVTAQDVVRAFVIFTERLLAQSPDPRHPATCQFIDLSGVSVTTGFRVDTLKQIYHTFEPNYPETLHKMVIYPVSSFTASTAKALLSFVNETTKKKFLITNDLDQVCAELGWSKAEVEACGGVTQFMHKHETDVATTLLVPPPAAAAAAAATATNSGGD